MSIDDVKTPASKRDILDSYEAQADKVETQFRRIITDGERQQEVRIWTDATAEVQAAMEKEFKAQRFNPIDMMVGSASREHDPDASDRRDAASLPTPAAT